MHATTHRRLLLATVLIAALLMSLLPPATPQAAAAPAAKTTGAPTDRLIVKFRQSTDPGTQAARTPAQIATRMSALGGEQMGYVIAGGQGTHLLKVNDARDIATMEALARRIAASPDVEYAEPDYIASADLTPNDLYYATKNWHLQSQSATNYSANLPTAWDITTGSTGITVAVVDTGALLTHEDLAGRHNAANPGYDMISDTARAQDSSGRDADPSDPGTYDFAATTCPTHESSWHGAHVAGTIGASANNGKGVTGINWVSPLLHLRALGRCGSGSSLDIADAMLWAAGEAVSGLPTNPNPARVINLSLGGQNPCSTTYQNTINTLLAKNVVVVVSAGNSNLDASGFSPASCAGVITVAATTWDGSRAYYSNYGTTVEIAAPGGGGKTDIEYSKYIYSTVNAGTQGPTTDAYADYQGTSMAAPHVAGIVSLMLSVNPSLTNAEVLSIIQTTATAFPAGSTCTTSTCGSGIINAAAAVEEAARRVRTAGFASAGQSISEAAGSVVLPITLPTKSNQTVTVPFTVAGTASGGGVDYTLANGTLTYPAGTTTQNITLAIANDTLAEGSETVVITLGTPTNAVLGATTAHTVTILDNDPGASVSPSSLSFGNQQTSTTSAAQTVTLTNSGGAALSLSNIAVSGSDFARSGGTCATTFPATLNAGSSCTVGVTFTPASAGAKSGSLTFTNNATGSPHTVSLGGTGIAPGVGLSTTTVSFGNQQTGSTSAAQTVTLTNSGAAALSLSNIAVSGSDFARSGGTCATSFPATLNAGASCTVLLTFGPTSTGAKSGTLAFTSNATGSPHNVSLSGTGTAPAVGLSTTTVSFGGQQPGVTSAAQTVTITNTGTAALSLSNIAVSGSDFARSGGTCATSFPATLNAGASCTVGVTFTPASTGAKSGTLAFTSNATGSPHNVSLSGTGALPAASLSATSLSFADQQAGVTSATQTVTLTNSGGAALTINAIAVSGSDFARSGGTCATSFPASLAAGSSCTVGVTFTPASTGAKSGTLAFTNSASGSPHNVTLSGNGIAPAVSLTPASINYGNLKPGWNTTRTFTLSNTGSAPLTISNTVVSGTGFSWLYSSTCPVSGSLNAGASCTIQVIFSATAVGSFSGTLTVTTNAANSPHVAPLTVAVYTPSLTASPTSVSFGNQHIGTTSAAQTITLAANSSVSTRLTGITVSGTGYARSGGTCSTTFPSDLSAGSSCTLLVTFTPTATGTLSGTISVSSDATGSPHTVSLSGTGANLSLGVSTTSVSFGNQQTGTTSAAQTVTITNTGNANLSLSNIAVSGSDFARNGGTCATSFPATLAAGASCTVGVTFNPATNGAKSGTLAFTSNATGSPHNVSLSGTGIAPGVGLSTTTVSFGNQQPGTTSAAQTVTITNTGNTNLSLSNIAVSGSDFARNGGTCATSFPATLAAGASCTVGVTFNPATNGAKSGTLAFTSNATGSPHNVSLSGTGIAPGVGLSTTTVSFGNQQPGVTSAAQTVTITNTGNTNLSLSNIAVSGSDFARSGGTCATTFPATLSAGASCTVLLTFTPASAGAKSGTLAFTSNATGSPHSVSLSGTGTAPAVSLTPATVAFPNTNVGGGSGLNATLTNTGSAPLTLSSITVSGAGFVWVPAMSTCTATGTVAAGASCVILLNFLPTVPGAASGTLSVANNATGSPHTVALTGTGIAPAVSLSTTTVSFGNQQTGTTSAAQTVTITNTGNANLSLSNIAVSGSDFARSGGTCATSFPATLNAGASCTVGVTFTPASAGAKSGTLAFTSNATGSPHNVSLSGTGIAPAVSLSTTTVSFGNQQPGTTSAAQTVTLTNSGNANLSLSNIAVSGSDFARSGGTCATTFPATLNAGASCTVLLTFTPATTGAKSGTLAFTSNAAGSPHAVSLSGTGTAPAVSLSTTTISFGNQETGVASAAQTVTLTNSGNTGLYLSGIAVSGSDFARSGGTCATSFPASLAAGASCTVGVTFTPATTGAKSGSLTFTSNAAGSPHTVSLSGTGVTLSLGLSTTTVSFGNQQTGVTSAAQTVTISNNGTAALGLLNIAVSGSDFARSGGTCATSFPTTLGVGASCTVQLLFHPATTGAKSGTLTFTTSASGSPHNVSLSGTGVSAIVSLAPATTSFGSVAIGSTSAPQTVTLANTGNATLSISELLVGGTGYLRSGGTCPTTAPTTLAAGASCTITAVFAPTTAGASSGGVMVTSNAAGSPHSVTFSGTGYAPSLNPSTLSMSFGFQPVGTSSAAQTFTMTAGSEGPTRLDGIAVSGSDFARGGGTCPTSFPASLAAGASCTVLLTFTPASTGAKSGSLVVSSNLATSPNSVSLSGTGVAPAVSLSTPSVSFGSQRVGATSSAQSVTLTNSGTAPLALGSLAVSGSDFARGGGTCPTSFPASLSAGASCTILLSFTPASTGAKSGSLVVGSDAAGSPHSVGLSGTGTAPAVGLSATSVSFADQRAGTTSAAQAVTLTNGGTAALSLSNIAVSGSAFARSGGTCATAFPATLSAGASCTILVTFTPAGAGAASGALTISSDATGSPHGVGLSGTGTAPGVGLSTTSVSFGVQQVGTTSAPSVVTLSNSGTAPLAIGNIAVSGSAFARGGGTCAASFPATLAAAESCTIELTFSPAGAGAASGTLTISSDAAGSPHAVSLSGSGVAPIAGVNPSSLAFGDLLVGTTSAPAEVTLTNDGATPLALTDITVSGTSFARSGGTCDTPTTLEAGASCTVAVVFAPTAGGPLSGELRISTDAGAPYSVGLSGTGTAPALEVAPASLGFGDQRVGTTSAPVEATLTNSGTAPLTVGDIVVSGEGFARGGGTCAADFPLVLAAGASCTVEVTFAPTAGGAHSGELSITTELSETPAGFPLSGTGLAPAVGVSPFSLGFSMQPVGTTSAPETITLSNDGTAPLTVSDITLSGAAFAWSGGTCAGVFPATLEVGASCTIEVSFTPATTGAHSGAVSIASDAATSPDSVSLSGTGAAPLAGLTPEAVSFGGQLVGVTSDPASVTLSNAGQLPLTVESIAVSGDDFALSGGTCGVDFPLLLEAETSCTIEVSFTPMGSGARSGLITIGSDALDAPHTASLSGTGLAPAVGLSTTTVGFANQLVGTTSAAQSVTLTNTGTAPLALDAIAVSGGDFARGGGTCATTFPATLAAGAGCTLLITFSPDSTGAKSGSLTIASNADGSPHTISLNGKGVAPAAGLAPTSLSFGSRLVGSASAASLVTLSNSGTAPMTISGIAIGGADFLRSGGTCATTFPATLNAGASCTIGVSFKPASVGAKSGTLSVATNAPGSPHTVSLSGTGIAPAATVSPTSLSFGGRLVGSPSTASTVTFSNSGTAPMTISAIAISGADFTRAGGTCAAVFPATLANGASCTVLVSFKPLTAGAKTGYLTFTSNAAGSPHKLTMTGTGATTSATASPTALSYGNVLVGATSAAQTVTLKNSGAAAMSISGIVISGADFIRSGGTCATTLGAGASCTVLVSFKPLTAGAKSGTLTITSNAAGSPHKVTLGGTGAPTSATVSPTALSFGGRLIGSLSAASTVTLSNSGTAAMSISGIAISGADFLRSGGTCATTFPATLDAGASCTVLVSFKPLTAGAKSGYLTFTGNAAGSPHKVTLTGTGAPTSATVSPTALSFGGRLVGSLSAASTVTLRNSGTAAMSISGIAISGADFARAGGTCATVFPATLNAGASCTIGVTFKPLAAGARTGSLTISSNAAGAPHIVGLSGSGGVTTATVSAVSLSFGSRAIGSTSPAQTITLTNSGAAAMSISGIAISGGDFLRTGGTCTTSLAAKASCTVLVSFKPLSAGAKSGALTITTNAVGSPHKVTLTGTGL